MSVFFRVFATLFAIPHVLYGYILLPLVVYGLGCKLVGLPGNPLDFSGHPHAREPSEGDIWLGLLVATVISAASALYGTLALRTAWTKQQSPRLRLWVRWLAVLCSIAGVGIWIWIVATSAEIERGEFLFVGGAGLLLYLGCNVTIAIRLNRAEPCPPTTTT